MATPRRGGLRTALPYREVCGKPRRGFTMVELMVVIGIMAVIMSISVPFAFRMLRKDPLQQAITDVTEACSEARAQAIIQGAATELRIRPLDRTLSIGAATVSESDSSALVPSAMPIMEPDPQLKAVPASGSQTLNSSFNWRISNDLIIEMVDVNFQERKDAEEARVRFFPNGTSDAFTLVLQWPARQKYRKISLDIVTGLAEMEVIR